MSDYPTVEARKYRDGEPYVSIWLGPDAGAAYTQQTARLLATRLVEVVGCEQVGQLRGLLQDMRDITGWCPICRTNTQHECKPDCRLRAALEGR